MPSLKNKTQVQEPLQFQDSFDVVYGVDTVTASLAVATGLTTCLGCIGIVNTGSAPGVGTSVITATVSGGNATLFAWKPTSSANPTLIAGTAPVTVFWIAFGNK